MMCNLEVAGQQLIDVKGEYQRQAAMIKSTGTLNWNQPAILLAFDFGIKSILAEAGGLCQKTEPFQGVRNAEGKHKNR